MVSSYSNQVVPTLVGKLLDPTSPSARLSASLLSRPNSTTTTTTTATSLATSILWVGLVGGTASFVRTLLLHQAHESIAARLRKLAFQSLLTQHDLEWFHTTTTTSPSNDEEPATNENTERNNNNSSSSNNQDSSENKKDDDYGSQDISKDKDKSSAPVTAPSSMTPGAIGVILRDDVEAVASTMTTTLANLFRSSSSCIFSSYNMMLLNPQLFGLSLAVAPIVGTLA